MKGLRSFYLLYFLTFAASGVLTPYLSLLYKGVGLSDGAVGVLAAVGPAASLLARPLWGIRGDRGKSKTSLLRLALAGSLLSGVCLLLARSLLILVPVVAALFVFSSAVQPLSDTVALEALEHSGAGFSPIRMTGSLGYAVVAVASGWLLERDIRLLVPVFVAISLGGLLSTLDLPHVAGHQTPGNRRRFWDVLGDRWLVVAYVYVLLLQTTAAYNSTFQSIAMKSTGINVGFMGLAYMVGSLSQYPFLWYADRILDRFGTRNVLVASGLVHGLRWLLWGVLALHPAVVLLTQLLHGGTYMVLYYSLARYVNDRVPRELKASGQMLNSVVLSGLSAMLGGALGGAMAASYSIATGYLVAAGACLAGTVAFFAGTLSATHHPLTAADGREPAGGHHGR